ncbi:glycerophosphocholine cholinephosphodiesterase ENPP6-like [Tubulanus polymorphus]|uniref:glycerophosphocholine cholinephosphodiesterase ENPP6-like n=1 Tax=Tubulanus polymorphus TaxID=672921 RepID=UPI003DA36952
MLPRFSLLGTIWMVFFGFRYDGIRASGGKLLTIVLDGIPHYAINNPSISLSQGFDRIRANGVWAKYVTPDFPTLSLPNFYSMMTGNHVDKHGIVGNFFVDPNHCNKSSCPMFNEKSAPESFWWEDSEPVWITAEKQGKRSYMYYWPGCEAKIFGVRPTFCRPYSSLNNANRSIAEGQFIEAADEAVDNLATGRADFAVVYTVQTDNDGHHDGSHTSKYAEHLESFDKIIGNVLTKIESNTNLTDSLNVMVVSDHGMTNLLYANDISKIINAYINVSALYPPLVEECDFILGSLENQVPGVGSVLLVWPKDGNEQRVYRGLVAGKEQAVLGADHMKIYSKNRIPKRWHFRNNLRVPPILLVADPGYILIKGVWPVVDTILNSGFVGSNTIMKLTVSVLELAASYIGNHGYDNNLPDMGGIFLAMGPAFEKGKVVDGFPITADYQAMAHVLGITSKATDSNFKQVETCFKSEH